VLGFAARSYRTLIGCQGRDRVIIGGNLTPNPSRAGRRTGGSEGPLRDLKTGTGFAGAKLSEVLPAARVARFVRMTDESRVARSFIS
jgi:hypothetical protein